MVFSMLLGQTAYAQEVSMPVESAESTEQEAEIADIQETLAAESEESEQVTETAAEQTEIASDDEVEQTDQQSEQNQIAVQSEEYAQDDFTYEVLNGTYCAITGYTGKDSEIIIPSEINGYCVQSLSANVFAGNLTIKKIILPETIESIGNNAFKGCSQLEYIFKHWITENRSNAFMSAQN